MMWNRSEAAMAPGMFFYLVTACSEYAVAVPVNLWALGLIASSGRGTLEPEVLTLNLLWAEVLCSLLFLLWLIQDLTDLRFSASLSDFYAGVRFAGRTLFQWHLCIDRYLAVAHPIIFIRYKQVKYRVACLVPLWIMVVACGLGNTIFTMNPLMVSVCALMLLVPSLSTEALCSLVLVRILRRSGPGARGSRERQGDSLKRRAVRIIVFLALMAVINNLTFLLFPAFDPDSYQNFFPVALALSTIGSSVHGFLYLSRARKLHCSCKG